MNDCEILDDNGNPVTLKDGDIITSDGGMLGLGHAGIVRVRNGKIEVLELFERQTPEGKVEAHVQINDICDFLDRYQKQKRNIFISRPKKPADTSDQDWADRLDRIVNYIEEHICNHYPVDHYLFNAIWDMPDVWYCSEIIFEAFKREGIDLSANISYSDSSSDKESSQFLKMLEKASVEKFSEKYAQQIPFVFTFTDESGLECFDMKSFLESQRRKAEVQAMEKIVESFIYQAKKTAEKFL